ncbi:helix-turn-helix transcriptional regulator [Pseudoneobacillus sp. C159]
MVKKVVSFNHCHLYADQGVYWLEVTSPNGKIETTDKVHSWNGALALLEANQWSQYQLDHVEPVYFDLIFQARSKTTGPRKNFNAQQRLLEVYKRLERGETVVVKQATEEFDIGRVQIQRDVKAINEYLEYSNKLVEYNRGEKGYRLNTKGDFFTIDDALFVLLLLYGSRTLNKDELKKFSGKMISLFSIEEQIKIREFFQSYLFHYEAVQEQNLFELFYTCFQSITEKRLLRFTYTNNRGETKTREVQPYTITYHDRKFYLLASKKDSENSKPFTWQLDRMEASEVLKQKFSASINVGEYIHKAVEMHGGEPQKVRMKVRDTNIEYLKRNFPKAQVQPSAKGGWVDVQVEVLGYMGIKLWILKQGPHVEVVEPAQLREEVKQEIWAMYQIYAEPASNETSLS